MHYIHPMIRITVIAEEFAKTKTVFYKRVDEDVKNKGEIVCY